MKTLIAIALSCVCSLFSVAHALSALDAQRIINRGKGYLFGDSTNADSAAACFAVVANTYRPSLSLEQKEKCGTAANNLAFVNIYHIGNYRAAYEALVKAREICNETGKPLTTINVLINLGNIYSIFSEQVDSPELSKEALNVYKEAFHTAIKHELWHQVLTIFNNLTSMRNDFSYSELYRHEVEVMEHLTIPSTTPNYHYTMLRLRAIRAYYDHDWELATTLMKAQRDNVDADMTIEAYRSQAITLTSAMYNERAMPDSALFYARELLGYAQQVGMSEVKANARLMMYTLLNDLGHHDEAHRVHAEYLAAKDSLLNYRELYKVDNLKFMQDLAQERRKAELLLLDSKHKRKVREWWLLFAAILLAITVSSLLYVVNRHRKLRARYNSLYEHQQRILLQEAENRKKREAEMDAVAKRSHSSGAYNIPPSAVSQTTRILAIMDETQEKFSTDFSLERLAELVGINSRALSAVLNDALGTTFRDLLNQYRVREACARLQDHDNYGHLTIEAISQSVGYKSRTSLIAAFKKETGLTPSHYQRIALERKS